VSAEVTDKILTIPNLLSLIRLLLVPVFYALFVVYGNDVLGFIVFFIAASTDWVDGKVARATNTVSRFGQQFDPFVDRILIVAGVIALFVVGRLPLWILVVLIARDAVLFCLTLSMRARFQRALKVIFLGKLATALLMAGFASLILNWPILPGAGLFELSFLPGWGAQSMPLGIWLLYLGVLSSLVTAVIYFCKGIRSDAADSLPLEAQPIDEGGEH
jgi:cardiolipin synthase